MTKSDIHVEKQFNDNFRLYLGGWAFRREAICPYDLLGRRLCGGPANNPPVVRTAALAVREVNEVLELIQRLRGEGVGIIFISHRLQDVMAVCNRLVFMSEGRNVAERQTAETTLEEVIQLIVQA